MIKSSILLKFTLLNISISFWTLREYLAFYKSEFLKATYSVFFTDSIYGCIAVHDFAEMLKHKYNEERVNFVISNEKLTFQYPQLLDIMINKKSA